MLRRFAGATNLIAASSLAARRLSSAARPPLDVLGIQPGTTKTEIKRTFYERAKVAHPDHGGDQAAFVELLAAFEALMLEPEPGATSASGSVRSARQTGGARRWQQRATTQKRQAWTLGETLCDRLHDEPEAFAAVYEEVKQLFDSDPGAHRATDLMLDALFAASVRNGGVGGALELLRDGKAYGLMRGPALVGALSALIKHGSADASPATRLKFEVVVEELPPHEQTPEALERLHSSYLLHFGFDPLTSWM